MTAFPSYSTGTVAISSAATSVVGTGTNWTGQNAMPGDTLVVAGHQVIVQDVTDATHLAIDAWPFSAVSGGTAYVLYKTSPLRFAGGQAMADVSALVAALNTTGYFVFVGAGETVPDPSLGEDGQFAYQPSTGKTWSKTGGVWVLQPGVAVGIRQSYSSTTADADPGAGTFRLNNATPASATAAYLDNVDAGGATVSGIIDMFDDSTSTVRGILRFQKATDPAVWAQFNVTGSVVDGTGYRKLTLANGAGSGAFTAADEFVIVFYRTGDIGLTGASGIRQAYSSTTTDSDPGAGTFRLNNATPASATAAYLDNVDAGGATVSGIWDTYDDSTSTVRGTLRFEKSTNPAVWAQFNVTGSVVDGTGYRKLTLASGVGSGSFTAGDLFSISFSRTGNSSAGDVLAANNGTEFTAATFAANLALLRYASQALTSSQRTQARANISAVLRGHLAGLTLSTAGNSSSFQVAEGECADSTAVDIMAIASSLQKNTGAWSLGVNGGALDTGSVSNTWYHVYVIKRPDTGVVDVLMSLSATAPTLPTNYTLFRRIGSLKVESSNYRKFLQIGDMFLWDVASVDITTSSQGTTAVSYTLNTPNGIKTVALLRAYMSHASTGNVALLSSLDESDQSVAGSNFNLGATQMANGLAASSVQVLTNTSSQIRGRSNASSTTLGASTYGWIDTRGRQS